jgi:hypothetical protein
VCVCVCVLMVCVCVFVCVCVCVCHCPCSPNGTRALTAPPPGFFPPARFVQVRHEAVHD